MNRGVALPVVILMLFALWLLCAMWQAKACEESGGTFVSGNAGGRVFTMCVGGRR